MKKALILILSLILISTTALVFTSAQTEEIDGFEFNIAAIDGSIAGEDGVIVTNQAGLATANLSWAISIHCEKVENNLYRAKADAIQGAGAAPDVTMATDDIVIGIHSSTSDVSQATEYPNVYSKLAALEVKAGMYFTLENIDLTAKTSTNGKAILSVTDPRVEDTSSNDLMGDPVDNPGYVLDVAVEATYTTGQTLNVTITMRDIVPTTGIGLISLKLYYDAAKVDPVVLNDGSLNTAMDAFLTTAPGTNNWEGLSKLEDTLSRYDLSFSTTDAASHAKEDGSLVITVPFTVKATTTGPIVFQVPHAETSALDYDMNTIVGNGGQATSNPAAASESSATSSDVSSQAPQMGDKGSVIFVVFAIVAFVGMIAMSVRIKRKHPKQ